MESFHLPIWKVKPTSLSILESEGLIMDHLEALNALDAKRSACRNIPSQTVTPPNE